MRLWEETTDDMGNKYPHEIGRATWQQTPAHSSGEFVMVIDQPPLGDALFLETGNGDNPAIELHDFRFYYPVTRMLFKATPDPVKPVWLYYGNPDAATPHYDLSLVGRGTSSRGKIHCSRGRGRSPQSGGACARKIE